MYKKTIKNHIAYINSNFIIEGRTIFVYKGFPNEFIKQISLNIKPVFGSLYYLDENKTDLRKINKNISSLVSLFLTDRKKISFLLYEEFISISRNINLELSKSKIYIIENNILNEFPNQSNLKFEDIEKEIEKPTGATASNEMFDYYYSYSTYYNQINFIQYQNVDVSEFTNISRINFFDTLSFSKIIKSKKNIFNGVIDNSYDLSSEIDLHKLVCLIFYHNKNLLKEINIIIDDSTDYSKREILAVVKFLFEINGIAINILSKSEGINVNEVRPDFSKILKDRWQSDGFRDLTFYKNPDVNNKTKIISQGVIIEKICRQAEFATAGKEFSDVFITAPTGSGKSVLFQIPAIYLSDKFKAMTIVISPLKALMYDQVNALKEKRGVNSVEYINSDVTFIERERIINSIKNGKISILYLSPELLLSYDIKNFIGERKIGLFVIDEAHLVTTWGRDFRVDYWYLGKYIRKLRKYNDYSFPVLALTATATYSGKNDIVFETIDSLNMKSPIIYVGNVRRDEIKFDIINFEYNGSHELAKLEKTKEKIENNIKNKIKTIVYFPWTSQIKSIITEISDDEKKYVGEYYSNVDKYKKQLVIDNFLIGDILVVLATKAFGMGVDVSDIKEIYHHAVSGGIPDYIQEVGRVARNPSIQGIASTDFNPKDLKFSKILYGLSSIKQYQVKLVLEKIWDIYKKNKKQNFLVSADDFGHIFDNESGDIESKVKSAFLLLENDLFKKYNYLVLIVRPKSMFTKVYAAIDKTIEKKFLSKYGKYVIQISSQINNQMITTRKNEVVSTDPGNIYQISLNDIWEQYFTGLSFPMAKRKFFDRSLFEEFNNLIYPRYNLKISLNKSFSGVYKEIEKIFKTFEIIFEKLKGKYFTKKDFEKNINQYFNDNLFKKRCSELFLNLYTSRNNNFIENNSFDRNKSSFIQAKRCDNGMEQFKIMNSRFSQIMHQTFQDLNDMFGNLNSNEYNKFLETNGASDESQIRVAYLIETFGLGSYEILGGKLPQIFIRINDPYKIKLLSQFGSKYRNETLVNIDERHKDSMNIMSEFFTTNMSNDDRWQFIEDYFLGKR